MAILNDSYQYIGRSNGVGCPNGYHYYILLYAKTSGSIATGQHKVTVLQRLACDADSSFYGWLTSGSVTAGDATITSWSGQRIPDAVWNSTSITEAGVTYRCWIDLTEGAAIINTGYGKATNIKIAADWVMNGSHDLGWFPYTGKHAKVSVEVTLPVLATASTISDTEDVTLGNRCSVTWTPQAASFLYKLKFTLGSWSHTTAAIHPNVTSVYTYASYEIPLEVARQLPNAREGRMTVTLYTYSDSDAGNQIGDANSAEFNVTVPVNASTMPDVGTMTLTPQHAVPADGVYVMGKSKVKASFSGGSGQLGASIVSRYIEIGNKQHGDPYLSGILSQSGNVEVKGVAVDSRGIPNSVTQTIPVVAYEAPKILPATDETSIICKRCDEDGNYTEAGQYLRIKARRSFSPVEGFNSCSIRYRWKEENGKYTAWKTILADDRTENTVDTKAIPDVVTDTTRNYVVQVGVSDAMGESQESTIFVPSDSVTFHLRHGGKGAAFGEYATEENLLSVGFDIRARGKVTLMEEAKDPTDAVSKGYVDARGMQEYTAATNDANGTVSLVIPEGGARYFGIFTTMGSQGHNASLRPVVFVLETGYDAGAFRLTFLSGSGLTVSYADGAYLFSCTSGWVRLWLKRIG